MVRDQFCNNIDICNLEHKRIISGETRVPRLRKRWGIVLRDRRSAETLRDEGMYRAESFSMNLYFRRFMADTVGGATTR